MTSNIDIDPEYVHQFRAQISDAIDKLREQFNKTENAINEAAESWKDSQFIEFQRNFEEDKEELRPLWEVLERYEGEILYDLENKLNDYNSVTMRV